MAGKNGLRGIFPAIQFDEPIDDGPVSNHTSSTSNKAPTTSKATTSSKRKVTPVDLIANELETYSQWGKRQKKNQVQVPFVKVTATPQVFHITRERLHEDYIKSIEK